MYLTTAYRGIHLGICTDTCGRECWKPNPRAFEYVEQVFGRSGGSLTYVADNPSKDFTAPRARGWQTVQIAQPYHRDAGQVLTIAVISVPLPPSTGRR